MEGNNWDDLMAQFAAMQPSASGWDGGQQVIHNGQRYRPGASYQTNSDGSITYTGGGDEYVSAIDAPWAQGQMGNIHDLSGNVTSSFELENPNAVDPMEMLILAGLAAGGGATLMGLGGGGLGLGNSALGSLGGLGGVAEAGTAAGMMGGAGAAGTAAMGGAGSLMGPMTEAQVLAGHNQLAQTLAPYLSPSSVMGPLTESQMMQQSNLLHQQLAPYLANPGVIPPGTTPGAPPGGPGVPPPANPFAPSGLESLIPGASSLLGPAAALLGGAAGAAGTPGTSQNSTRAMDPRMDALFYNDLAPRTQGLLGSSMPQAQGAGDVMRAQGTSLLNRSTAGNGVGQVQLNAPTTSTNPYLSGMADDIGRRTQDMLQKNNLGIQSNYVGGGGTGNTRQGVAQGVAAGNAADYLSGNLSNLFGTQYSNDQNRALQQYGMDQSFYTGQRGQDLAQVGVGAGLVNQGLQAPWQPLQSASQTYSPFTGFGSTTNSTPGQSGGWQGALGGALTGASLGKQMGWW